MNILAIVLLILSGGLLLTIRSMKNLLSETRPTHAAPPQAHTSSVILTPPVIIESNEEMRKKITEIISHQKVGNLGDITIEKLFFGSTVTYALYHSHHATIWTTNLPEGYIVEENTSLNAHTNVLAHQYIIRHKYADVFYLSKRSLLRKPPEYIVSGIDHMHWQAFFTRQHTTSPNITTGDRIFNQITSEIFSRERRTAS